MSYVMDRTAFKRAVNGCALIDRTCTILSPVLSTRLVTYSLTISAIAFRIVAA
jgi:hypothetical protein